MRESTDRADPDVSVPAPQPHRPQPFATGLVALALTALLFVASLAGLIGAGPAPALALNDAQAEGIAPQPATILPTRTPKTPA